MRLFGILRDSYQLRKKFLIKAMGQAANLGDFHSSCTERLHYSPNHNNTRKVKVSRKCIQAEKSSANVYFRASAKLHVTLYIALHCIACDLYDHIYSKCDFYDHFYCKCYLYDHLHCKCDLYDHLYCKCDDVWLQSDLALATSPPCQCTHCTPLSSSSSS